MEREIKIDVQNLEGKGEIPFKGEIVLKVRPYRERLKLAQELSSKKDEDSAELADHMIQLAYDNVVSVSLSMGKKKFTDLDELSYYKEGADLINRIAASVASGPSLGN